MKILKEILFIILVVCFPALIALLYWYFQEQDGGGMCIDTREPVKTEIVPIMNGEARRMPTDEEVMAGYAGE